VVPSSSERRLRVLILTKVFPNAVNRQGAPYNRQQFAALSRLCDLELLGLIPWFPGARLFAGKSEAGRLGPVPPRETIEGLDVRHPRAFYFPRFGHSLNPLTFSLSLLPAVLPLRRKVDVILGSWAFPDGLAAIQLGRWLKLPVVVKVQGSDLNVLPSHASIRRALSRKLPRADRLMAVSRALGAKARELGVADERIAIVPNGVDRALFSPRDRAEARRELNLPDGRLILFVGRVEPAKGVVELLQAFEKIAPSAPGLALALVGDGPEMPRYRRAAEQWPGRVFLPGQQTLTEVGRWLAACDVLTLPSWNEGSPNVILEAMASGRRVVATRVGGIPDLMNSSVAGEMVAAHSADELATALLRVTYTDYDPTIVASAGPPDWHRSAHLLHEVLLSAHQGTPLPRALRMTSGPGGP
jgi:glycosyltransferase involved in cell wall biosynthesis